MNQKSNTIVFFGSGPVAAKCLDLLSKHAAIEAVVTKPRAAHHRGSVPVLETAEKLGLPVFTPQNKKELSELFCTKPVVSQLGIVIDYGIIIAQDVIDYFPLGIINSHFSLLPEWRGADPITFAVLSGQEKTGVSLMLITAGMDEGPILAYGEYPLAADITTPLLTDGLIKLSDSLLRTHLPRHFMHETSAVEQIRAAEISGLATTPTYSRKLTKDDGIIDWSKPAETIEREIRAFQDWPKSRTQIGTINVVITASSISEKQISTVGSVVIEQNSIFIGCGTGSLQIVRIKPAGKNEMPAEAFLAGYKSRIS